MNKGIVNKFKKNQNIIIFVLVLVIILFMTVGFALYGEILHFGGNVTLKPDGVLSITNISLVNSANVSSSEDPVFNGTTVEFNVVFSKVDEETDEFFAIYSADVVNDSSYEYAYNAFNFVPVVNSSGGGDGTLSLDVSGISNGDIIKPGETRTITMKLTLEVTDMSQDYDVSGSTDINVEQNTKGSVLASVSPIDVDLTGNNTKVKLNLEVINSYINNVSFTVKSSNGNFVLVDENGDSLSSFTISANSNDNYSFYIMKADNGVFYDGNEEATLILTCDSIGNVYTEKIYITVDASSNVETNIPQIGDITFTINNTVGSADLQWSRLDEGLSVTSYTILLYKDDGTYVDEFETNSELTNYTLTDLEEGSYYVKIYGTDKAGTNGSEYVDTADLTTVYCRKSETVALKWVFSVTNNITGVSSSGATTVNLGNTYTATLSPSFILFSLPDTIEVSMGGVSLDASKFDYDSNTGALSIENVTGDIILSGDAGSSGCLVEGTLVKLANGSNKNIEDITYNDLLKVWSYEEGKFVYQYPIWIEETKVSNQYLLIKFDNGRELKIVGDHGVYNVDLNMFVSVHDQENFGIGTNVAFLNDSMDGFTSAKVINIKYIDNVVKYYHVVSTRYYNIIANDFLTTDDAVILSNLYGFNDDITWPSIRDYVISDKNNLYKYEEFSDIMPYYMFKGLRAEEGKILNDMGYLSKDMFRGYLIENQVNPDMLLEPIVSSNGKRIWMVSTSDNNLNNFKGTLIQEGNYYKLGLPKKMNGFLYWYDVSSGTRYNIGDFVQIWHGTHFEAVYE